VGVGLTVGVAVGDGVGVALVQQTVFVLDVPVPLMVTVWQIWLSWLPATVSVSVTVVLFGHGLPKVTS